MSARQNWLEGAGGICVARAWLEATIAVWELTFLPTASGFVIAATKVQVPSGSQGEPRCLDGQPGEGFRKPPHAGKKAKRDWGKGVHQCQTLSTR